MKLLSTYVVGLIVTGVVANTPQPGDSILVAREENKAQAADVQQGADAAHEAQKQQQTDDKQADNGGNKKDIVVPFNPPFDGFGPGPACVDPIICPSPIPVHHPPYDPCPFDGCDGWCCRTPGPFNPCQGWGCPFGNINCCNGPNPFPLPCSFRACPFGDPYCCHPPFPQPLPRLCGIIAGIDGFIDCTQGECGGVSTGIPGGGVCTVGYLNGCKCGYGSPFH